jgi:hypothetical protein
MLDLPIFITSSYESIVQVFIDLLVVCQRVTFIRDFIAIASSTSDYW